MSTVVLDRVSKVYENGYQAIHDLSLDIADGEFLVLVVPSGCGKSPALRAYDGKPVIVGIRPEDFEDAALVPDPPQGQ